MKAFTLWLGRSERACDIDHATRVDLAARTAEAAVRESHRRWASLPQFTGPAHLWIFENQGGRLVYEMPVGPSC